MDFDGAVSDDSFYDDTEIEDDGEVQTTDDDSRAGDVTEDSGDEDGEKEGKARSDQIYKDNPSWQEIFTRELLSHPLNYFSFNNTDKKTIREHIRTVLLQHGHEQTDDDINNAIYRHIMKGRKFPKELDDEVHTNWNLLLEKKEAERRGGRGAHKRRIDPNHSWLKGVLEKLVESDYFAAKHLAKKKIRETIAGSLLQHDSRKTERSVYEVTRNYVHNRMALPPPIRDDREAEANLEILQKKILQNVANKAPWIGFLLQELVLYPDYFKTRNRKKDREAIGAALLQKHNIVKTDRQLKRAIVSYVFEGKRPPRELEDEENERNWKLLVEKAALQKTKAAWIGLVFQELVDYPDFFKTKNKEEIIEKIAASLLQKHSIKKEEGKIRKAIAYYFRQPRKIPQILKGEDNERNFNLLMERVALQKERGSSRRATKKKAGSNGVRKVVRGRNQKRRRNFSAELSGDDGDEESSTEMGIGEKVDRVTKGRPRGVAQKTPRPIVVHKAGGVRGDNARPKRRRLSPDLFEDNGRVDSEADESRKKNREEIDSDSADSTPVAQKVVRGGNLKRRRNASPLFTDDDGMDYSMNDDEDVDGTINEPRRRSTSENSGANQIAVEKKAKVENQERSVAPEMMIDDDYGMGAVNDAVDFDGRHTFDGGEAEFVEAEEALEKTRRKPFERIRLEDVRKKIAAAEERVQKQMETANEEKLKEVTVLLEQQQQEKIDEAVERAREEMRREYEEDEKQKITEAVERTRKEVTARLKQQQQDEKKADNKRITPPFSTVKIGEISDDLMPFLSLKGKILGEPKLKITHAVGVGTFGLVFRGVEHEKGKIWAIKVVRDEISIATEKNIMEKIGSDVHRYIARPMESFSGEHAGIAFTAFKMPLLSMDLYAVICYEEHHQKIFTPASVLSILGQVFSALSFLNKKRLIYSDVKLENVLLRSYEMEKDGEKELLLCPEVCLIDMNSVFSVGDCPEICQTARYRAPEIVLDYKPEEEIDSWSVGVLALELLYKDFVLDVEYEGTEEIQQHIVRIQELVGEQIPQEFLRNRDLSQDELPDVPEGQPKMADILKNLGSSTSSMALQYFLPQLLTIDPRDRPSPSDAAESLKDAIRHP